jgi:head-tail adaptor
MLPPFVRAAIASALEQFLTDRALVEAQKQTKNAYGQLADTWTTIAKNEPCRIRRMTPRQQAELVGGQEAQVEAYFIDFRHTAPIAAGQRATINGVVYSLVSIVSQSTDSVEIQAVAVRART